jgi:hypothetical protein
MARFAFLALFAVLFLLGLGACSSDEDDYPEVQLYPAVINYWRPISDPNAFLPMTESQTKLNYDIAQCRCSNFPMNYPHSDSATIAPDLGRLAETGATKVDTAQGCATTPEGVMLECMRARGWEPTSCSGRLNTPGGTTCAMAVGQVPVYPENYPYQNPYINTFDNQPTPAEERQRVR